AATSVSGLPLVVMILFVACFFFSSRRRHTRWPRDWSSDVCSSDLEALLARGDEVVGTDNFDPFYARALKERNLEDLRRHPRFRFLEADVARDPLPLDGVSVVIHLAARPGVRPSLEDPASYSEANVTGTVRVFEATRRAGI